MSFMETPFDPSPSLDHISGLTKFTYGNDHPIDHCEAKECNGTSFEIIDIDLDNNYWVKTEVTTLLQLECKTCGIKFMHTESEKRKNAA